MMRNIKILENLKYLFYFIIGFLLIFLVIYFRILYKKLPRTLWFYSTDGNINIIIIIFIFFMLLFSCLLIFISIRGITQKSIKIKSTKIVLFIIKINSILNNSLYIAYCFITNKIPDGFDLLGNIIMLFFNSKISKFEYIIFIIFVIRSIICISFLYDVFICFKLEFFYKSLSLLLIIILIDVWMFIIKDWSTTNVNTVKSYLDIESKDVGLPTEINLIKISKEYEKSNLNLDYLIQQYKNLVTMCDFSEAYENFKQYYMQRFNLIYYSLFLFGCLYVIGKNLILV